MTDPSPVAGRYREHALPGLHRRDLVQRSLLTIPHHVERSPNLPGKALLVKSRDALSSIEPWQAERWSHRPTDARKSRIRCFGGVGPKRVRYAGTAGVRVTENRSDTSGST